VGRKKRSSPEKRGEWGGGREKAVASKTRMGAIFSLFIPRTKKYRKGGGREISCILGGDKDRHQKERGRNLT